MKIPGFLFGSVQAFFLLILAKALNPNENSRKYVVIDSQLTEVPKDIRSTVEQVILDRNAISCIKAGTWTNLTNCDYLSLKDNKLRTISNGTFRGLYVLEHLNLGNNLVFRIHVDALCQVPDLKRLDLQNNQLTYISIQVFRCTPSLNYLDLSVNALTTFVMGDHTTLTLILSRNPLQCDSRHCWLKEGEENGSLIWYRDESGLKTPDCDNYPDVNWVDITLPCSEKVSRRWNGTNDTDTISTIVHETEKVVYQETGWIFGIVCLVILLLVVALLIWKCKPIDRYKTRNKRKVCPKYHYDVEQEEGFLKSRTKLSEGEPGVIQDFLQQTPKSSSF